MAALMNVWRCFTQFFRRTDEDATPIPEAAVKSYKKWCTGCLATALLAFSVAGLAHANLAPSYFIGIGSLIGGVCVFLVIFHTFLLYFTWSKINRIVPHDSNSPQTVQHPGGRGRDGYGTCNPREQRNEPENVAERPQPSAESPEGPGSPESPEVASTRGSNEDANDQSLLVTAEINNQNLQKLDSEAEIELELMGGSTKSTETSTSTDEPNLEAATEVADE